MLKVNPLIMTLGMASVLLGIIRSASRMASDRRGWADRFASWGRSADRTAAQDTSSGRSWPAVLILGCVRRSRRAIYASATTDRLPPRRRPHLAVLLAVYVLAGILAGSAGCCSPAPPLGRRRPDNNYLLPSVAATVIGGTSILGGMGATPARSWRPGAHAAQPCCCGLDTSEAFKQMLYGAIVLALAGLYVPSAARSGRLMNASPATQAAAGRPRLALVARIRKMVHQ